MLTTLVECNKVFSPLFVRAGLSTPPAGPLRGRERGTSYHFRHGRHHIPPSPGVWGIRIKVLSASVPFPQSSEKLLVRYTRPDFFRQRLVCSVVSSRPVLITKIREDDDAPGLRGASAGHPIQSHERYRHRDRTPLRRGVERCHRGGARECAVTGLVFVAQITRCRLRRWWTSSAMARARTSTRLVSETAR